MFTTIKWVLLVTFWTLVIAIFHYTLPQTDIVRVTETENRRQDISGNRLFWAQADAGMDNTLQNRDVFFIQTVRADGRVMVYRNEDTGWGWPPYFKFDTNDLQTEAADARSTANDPRFVAIKHYGWRINFFSIFPNAISIRPVDGPDASKGIPILNILIIGGFAAVVWAIWVRWRRFRERRIDPTLEAIEDDMAERGDAFRRWMGSWRKRT
ncbi:MAG: DUF1523 family protein [Pseudomonadota bacterium]